jgi:hypothetical protein
MILCWCLADGTVRILNALSLSNYYMYGLNASLTLDDDLMTPLYES